MSTHLEDLTHDECLRLLEGQAIGRVAVTIGALPAVLPVGYALLDDAIVFRTSPGTKLTAALLERVVAFEVDEADVTTSTGWSVLVVGRAQEIRDHGALARAHALDLTPWTDGSADHFVRIPLDVVSGRRIATSARDSG